MTVPPSRMKINEENMQFSKKSFRAPYKVHCVAISPVNDLIAIGSRKGDITLKRVSWKQIWKFNITQSSMHLLKKADEIFLDCLEFSPDGEVLAAGTSDGHVSVIDVETGRFKHYARVGETPPLDPTPSDITTPPSIITPSFLRLRWCPYGRHEFIETGMRQFWNEVEREGDCDVKASGKRVEENKATLYDQCMDLVGSKPDVAKEDIAFVYQMLEEDSSELKADEGFEDAIENTFISNRKFRGSYKDTILLAVRDDFIITVLLAGVYPYADIDMKKQCQLLKLEPVFVYDAFYSRNTGGITVAFTSSGERPTFDRSETFGKPITSPNPPSFPNGIPNHTHVINFKLNIKEIHWDLALRFIRLVYGFFLLFISFETCRKNWKTQIEILHNRFNTKIPNLKLGEVLIDMMLSGSTETAGEQFLERGMGMDGLGEINGFIEKHLTQVGRIARGQLVTGVRNLSFQVTEFVMCVNRIYDEERIENHATELLTKKFDDPTINPEAVRFREMNPAVLRLERDAARLELKNQQLQLACSLMIQDLSHLTKWLVMLKPFTRGIRANMLLRSKRMDIKTIMTYITENFVTEPTVRDNLMKTMFNIEELVEKINMNDLMTEFDELKYFEDAKNDAEHLHTIYKDELKSLRPDSLEFNKSEEMMMDSAVDMKGGPQADASRPLPTGHECPIDLDRVGSFFAQELSPKTAKDLPFLSQILLGVDSDKYDKNARGLHAVRTLGYAKVIKSMAEAVQGTRRILNCEPKHDKSNFAVNWMYEIASGVDHAGFEYCRITNVLHDDAHNDGLGLSRREDALKRSLHVACSTKKQLYSLFLISPVDIDMCLLEMDVEGAEAGYYIQRDGEDFGIIQEFSKFHDLNLDGFYLVDDVKKNEGEPMEVDENALRIDTGNNQLTKSAYEKLVSFGQVFPIFNDELIILANYESNDENGGVNRRMMRYVVDHGKKLAWIVQDEGWGTSEVVEWAEFCPYMRRGVYVHDEGTRVAIFHFENPQLDYQRKRKKDPIAEMSENNEEGTSDGTHQTTFREFQARRDRLRRLIPSQYAQISQFDDIIEEFIDTNAPDDMLQNMLFRRT